MAKLNTKTYRGVVPKKISIGSKPGYGTCKRWLQRIRRHRLDRCLLLSEFGGNKHGSKKLQLTRHVDKHPSWHWLLLLVCVFVGLCRERYSNSLPPSSVEANYCDGSHRLGDMVTHVRRKVLHQEDALDQLERALNNATFQNIALVGSSGVGKSHTARTLREQFPWPENVKTLSWKESPSLLRVQSMLTNILYCGQNLILIDDMTPLDGNLVPIINELIYGRKEIAKGSSDQPHLKKLTSVFVFSVDRQQPEEIFQAEIQALKQLPSTHVIIYAALEPSHLVDCSNVGALEELQQSINDVRVFGCKSIDAKKIVTEEEDFSDIKFLH